MRKTKRDPGSGSSRKSKKKQWGKEAGGSERVKTAWFLGMERKEGAVGKTKVPDWPAAYRLVGSIVCHPRETSRKRLGRVPGASPALNGRSLRTGHP